VLKKGSHATKTKVEEQREGEGRRAAQPKKKLFALEGKKKSREREEVAKRGERHKRGKDLNSREVKIQ